MATSKTKTTTTKKTTSRTSTAKKASTTTAAAKPSEAPAPEPEVTPEVVAADMEATIMPDEFKKKELVDLVVEKSGIKKKDAKPVVEAMLDILGAKLADDRELNLQPFGKIKVTRREDKENGRVFVCRVRQSAQSFAEAGEDAAANSPSEPLAEPAE